MSSKLVAIQPLAMAITKFSYIDHYPLMQENIEDVENAIDHAFFDNDLTKLSYSQAIWTLLAGAEEYHFRNFVINPTSDSEKAIVVDGLLNALTYPARAIHKNCVRSLAPIDYKLNDVNYERSIEWIGEAEDYLQFCAISPCITEKKLTLRFKMANF